MTRAWPVSSGFSGFYAAPVVAAGTDDHPPWLATAFVPGPAPDELITKHCPLPEDALWRLAAGLTEVLRAIHGSGVIHRDLKPSNVLLAADGPRLIDFGISQGRPAGVCPPVLDGVPSLEDICHRGRHRLLGVIRTPARR